MIRKVLRFICILFLVVVGVAYLTAFFVKHGIEGIAFVILFTAAVAGLVAL